MAARSDTKTGSHVCPWWCAYTFDNPLRRFIHDPAALLGPYVRPGMTVADIGCGMGHFSIGMARLVGPSGRVLAVDLQAGMLRVLSRRARRAGLADRISPRLCRTDDLGLEEPVDFALAFWMVHETPDPEGFFRQIAGSLRGEAKLMTAEPSFHVSAAKFDHILGCASRAGLKITGHPPIRFSRSALFGIS